MTLEEFLKTIAYFSDTYYYNPVTTSHDAVEKCWEFRQSEIDELKSRISELEKELDELDDKYLELKAQG